jgi:hypothetical protein
MKKFFQSILSLSVLFILISSALAARVGEPAPDFTATDSNGKNHHLADYKGKYVVLEWHNQGCRIRASITIAATCNVSRKNGRTRA